MKAAIRSVRTALLLLGTFTGGCASLPGNVFFTEPFASSRTPYGEALLRNTREAELYQGFDTVAKVWVSWKNEEVRRALAKTSVDAYKLKGEEAESLRNEEEKGSGHVREFHVALYTPSKQWNDLDSPSTLWRVYLKLPDGSRFTPVQIVRLPKSDKNPVEYPYVTRWTREYTILFPLLEEQDRQTHPSLLFTGPLGTMKLEF